MKRITILLLFTFIFSLSPIFAQQSIEDSRYLKRIENNYHHVIVELPNGKEGGVDNVDSKKGIEKLFFGDFNAKVEYFVEPAFYPATGFRICRDSLDQSYLLEVKWVANYEQVRDQVQTEFPSRNTSIDLPEKQLEENVAYNRKIWSKQGEEKLKRYRIETKGITISDAFAELVHAKTFTTIDTFRSKGRPRLMFGGGWTTFRCVQDWDVWMLAIQIPAGDMKKLSDLYRQMMADVEADRFDEAHYLHLLENSN